MATKRSRQKAKREIEKFAKKRPFVFFLIVVLVAVAVGVYYFWQKNKKDEPIITDDLQIHFLELGNGSSGDCTLIKTGDVEVLIDAGSSEGSAKTIVPYIQQYCTNRELEYVIATHADADHIAAFVGTSSYDGVFESFDCKTIIDFPKTTKNTDLYNSYVALRNAEVQAGAKHFTALQCWNNEGNGAQRSYTLSDGITLNILYNKYYEEPTSKYDENNNSVCILISQGNNHYLFTGDLESGESALVDNNDLPKCKLFKAGHHGSDTSNSDKLLEVIQPEYVAVNCAVDDKHGFPKQKFINNVAVWTDKVYVTTRATSDGFVPMNGTIVFTSDGTDLRVHCSNNDTVLKDTEWFQKNRDCPDAWKNVA